jgi:hypothetical protein
MTGSLMMCLSVVVLLAGMLAGGLYYRLVPAAGTTPLAKVQRWLHISGAILLPAGVAVVLLKGSQPPGRVGR